MFFFAYVYLFRVQKRQAAVPLPAFLLISCLNDWHILILSFSTIFAGDYRKAGSEDT